MEHPAVSKFREYLRIPTVQPTPNYDAAVKFLQAYLDEIGIPYIVLTFAEDRPILLATWKGEDPGLASVLLNSHTDVVPVYPDQWKYDPFAAVKDQDGKIYGRGAQDMKCVTIQYLAAIKRLKEAKRSFKRTIHLSFMPDEEIGGKLGMQALVHSADWKALNIGLALDEGLANPGSAFSVFYGERLPWWIKVRCPGNPGHGSRFIENTAAEKIRYVIDKFLDFRQAEKQRLESNPDFTLGDVTTVNLTQLEGGLQPNVVPAELSAVFDIRVTPHADVTQLETLFNQWCQEAGEGVTIEFLETKPGRQTITSIDKKDVWWNAFSTACEKMGMELKCEIFPASTDSCFIREAGIPALGFSPMNQTPILLHDHDEYLDEKVFLSGIDIYSELIPALADAC